MNNEIEYDSEFCNVRYVEKDSIVLFTWKNYARLDDYRKPALSAIDLLKQHPHSNFVVDARNGFEADKEDVKWWVAELLPNMAKTDCKYVIFIIHNTDEMQSELGRWTKVFGKYFAVVNVASFEQAVCTIHNRILVNVKYTIEPGKRDEFLKKVTTLIDSRKRYYEQADIVIDTDNEPIGKTIDKLANIINKMQNRGKKIEEN